MTKKSISDLFTSEILKNILDNIDKTYQRKDCPFLISDDRWIERHGISLIDSRQKEITITLDKGITGLVYIKDYHGTSSEHNIIIKSEKPIDDLDTLVMNSPFESITLYGSEDRFSIL